MYRTAVVENGFSYERFREDFIHSHTFHDSADADSRNDHLVNLGASALFFQPARISSRNTSIPL